MVAKIIDGKEIAEKIKQEASNRVKKLYSEYGTVPNVHTIKIGSNPQSDLYLKLRDKACEKAGIKTNHTELSSKIEEKQVIKLIRDLNNDRKVHGIFIQLPIPDHLSRDKLINSLPPRKDVEGLHPCNMGGTLTGNQQLIPCTPLAVLTILDHEKIKLEGKNVAIINHSNIVGKPLGVLVLHRNATVFVCHEYTKETKRITSQADVLITATGIAGFITKDFVKKNAVVIDVGIVKTEKGVCGDVDFNSVKQVASRITPVPGGVGPVTVACSLKNMVKTFENVV